MAVIRVKVERGCLYVLKAVKYRGERSIKYRENLYT